MIVVFSAWEQCLPNLVASNNSLDSRNVYSILFPKHLANSDGSITVTESTSLSYRLEYNFGNQNC